jgi:hypothetical protein
MTATIARTRAHIRRLCETHAIEINYGQPSASYELREIWIRPVRSDRSYATALHEIGHVLGRHRLSRVMLVRERWAWDWARRNALRWTPTMQRHARRCLRSYA